VQCTRKEQHKEECTDRNKMMIIIIGITMVVVGNESLRRVKNEEVENNIIIKLKHPCFG
jgi:Na+-transporting NADH:ubiquinone oxidoreductase subunit NqrC